MVPRDVQFVLREIRAMQKCTNMHFQTHVALTNASNCNLCVQWGINLHLGRWFETNLVESFWNDFNNVFAIRGVDCNPDSAIDPPDCKKKA